MELRISDLASAIDDGHRVGPLGRMIRDIIHRRGIAAPIFIHRSDDTSIIANLHVPRKIRDAPLKAHAESRARISSMVQCPYAASTKTSSGLALRGGDTHRRGNRASAPR